MQCSRAYQIETIESSYAISNRIFRKIEYLDKISVLAFLLYFADIFILCNTETLKFG